VNNGTQQADGRRRADVPLAVVGVDFRSAPASHRELLVATDAERHELFAGIRRVDANAGLLALETCNRVEWIVSCDSPSWMAELLKAQMLSRWCERLVDEKELPEVYGYVGAEAARHIFRVVSGMESLATGEAEIAGQFQRALQRAMLEQTSSRILNGLGRLAGGIAKSATRAGIRAGHTRGIHVLSGFFIKARIGSPATEPVAVLGMGEIGRKTADFLEQSADFRVVRINRTVKAQHEGQWRPLTDLRALSREVAAIVVASGSRTPVVTPSQLDLAGRSSPLVILDIGIPQQVDPAVRKDTGIRYFDVDDLLEVSRGEQDMERLTHMEEVVDRQVARFRSYCLEREWVVLLNRTQNRRFEMLGEDLNSFVEQRLGDLLDEVQQQRVVLAMKELVRAYSGDVFEAVHKALEEQWNSD
jgi:glutamyl-tRNA reductase